MHFKKSVLKNHLLYSIITLMAIAMLFPITAFAQAYVQTWDLVDSGKHLDYDGNKKDAKDIFTSNEIFAKEQNGKWGYVDKNGNTVVDFKYDMAIDLNEYGFGAVKQNGRWGVVDSKGNEIKAPTYELNEYAPNFIGEYYEVSSLYEVAYFTNEI